ncbi:hypothetical protein DKX38_028989 [Salix brachista]|uniref:FAD-dependent oxidoreductase 2 FAD-binding domain-containing protein n=1 Tax=Salix brachista TaxID=2182728 RepID=A0A5N5IYG4_9ROSI|nr:hypothetical protein DKX38_028989 [Salix brachista]
MERVEDVVIVGAGIAGLATAVALKKVGVRALLMEKSKGLRSTGTVLTLSPDVWLALDALGVSHKLIPLYIPSFKHTVNSAMKNGGLVVAGDMAKAIDDSVKERRRSKGS